MSLSKVVGQFLSGQEYETIKKPSVLFLVHLSLMTYAMCFWMQQPVLPFLSKELGAEGVAFGFLQSTVSIFALIGGPIFGQILDTKGAKISLILAQCASLSMYFLTGISFSLPILYLSRIPAIGQHAMLCSQAGITLIIDKSNRATAFGRLSLSYGLGMIIGGPLGGWLSENFGFRSSAFVAAFISFLMVCVLALFFEDKSSEPKSKVSNKEEEGLSLKTIKELLQIKALRDILLTNFFFSLGTSAFNTAFTLAAMQSFGFSSQTLGVFYSFGAVVSLFANVFFIPNILSYFENNYLQVYLFCAFSTCFSFVAFIQAYDLYSVCLVSIPLTLSSSAMYIINTSLVSSTVDETKQGTAISFGHATRSFVGLISPLIGGFVYEKQGLYGTCLIVSSLVFISIFYSQTIGRKSFELASVEKSSD